MSNTLNKLWGRMMVAFALALSGCAQNERVAAEDKQLVSGEKTAGMQNDTSNASAAGVTKQEWLVHPDYSSMNPVPIVFETFSVSLTDSNRRILEKILDRALAAGRLTIRGFADRIQIENAKDVAIERGMVVRDELVRLGVNPNVIRIKYSTGVADKHVAEIELHPAS